MSAADATGSQASGGSTRARALGFGAAYVFATFWAFPQLVAGRVIDLGPVVAYAAPAALIAALIGSAPRRAFKIGLAAGLAAHWAVLHWIYVVTVDYGNAPPVVGVLAPGLLALYIAAFPAAFAAGFAWLDARGGANPFVVAALWAALDLARSFVLSGFPWATLGYAQLAGGPLVGLAAWTGVYGLSFACALGGAGVVALARGEPRRGAWALGTLAVLYGLGGFAMPAPLDGAARVRIAVVQGNIPQGVKWSADWAERTLGIYDELTREAAADGARVVVWPETAVPGSPDGDPELQARLGRLAGELGVVLVVGAVGVDWAADPAEPPALFDSAFVYDADGRPIDRYDKTHLVPFGEYLPLRAILGSFIRAVATGSAGRDVSPGERPRSVQVPARAGEPELLLGVPICYELIFPDLVRRFAGGGAQVLIGITNDAWYGRTGAPYQFLQITAMRSVENGLWTARAANTGVSAFIDERGQVHEATPIFERGFRAMDVPLSAPGPRTPYARWGDVFAWSCAGAVLFAGARARGRETRRPPDAAKED